MANESASRRPSRGAEQLFPALLFFVFLICTIFTILIGSRVYENIRGRDNASFETDTALAYITNKVRQNDKQDAIEVRDINGCSVLVMLSRYGNTDYETWIYESGGQLKLKELFSRTDSGLGVDDGLDIMDCRRLTFAIEERKGGDRILIISLGDSDEARLLLRSSGAAQNHSSVADRNSETQNGGIDTASTGDADSTVQEGGAAS